MSNQTHFRPREQRPRRPSLDDVQAKVNDLIAKQRRFRDWTIVQYSVAILLGCACFPLGVAFQSFRTDLDAQPSVDGIVLSDDELGIIRGTRKTKSRLSGYTRKETLDDAERIRQLMDEKNGKLTNRMDR